MIFRLRSFLTPHTVALLLLGIFFALLPIARDISATLGATGGGILLCYWFAHRQGTLPPITGIPNHLIIIGGSFIFFCFWAFTSTLANPVSLGNYALILLWALAIITGFAAGRLLPHHHCQFLDWLLVALFASAALSTFLWLTGFSDHAVYNNQRLRFFTMHPSRFALLCALGGYYACNALLNSVTQRKRLLYGVAIAGCSIAIYFSAARAIILFYPLGLAGIIIFRYPRKLPLIAGICLLGAVLTGIFLYANKENYHAQRVISVVTNITNDTTFKTRQPIWEVGLAAWEEKPFLGQGVHSYREYYIAYREKNEALWQDKYQGVYDRVAKQAHNILLGRLAETGLGGAVSFSLFFLLGIYATVRYSTEQNRWIAAFLLFYLAIGIFDDPLYRRNDCFVFLLLGLGLAPSLFYKQKKTGSAPS